MEAADLFNINIFLLFASLKLALQLNTTFVVLLQQYVGGLSLLKSQLIGTNVALVCVRALVV